MFDKIKKLFTKEEVIPAPVVVEPIVLVKKVRKAKVAEITLPVKKPRKKKAEPVIDTSEKAKATAAGEPYVQVLGIELDQDNPGDGAFELDWNDIFVARLLKSGYQGKTDQDIVDNWFKAVCKNVLIETFENENADPEIRAAQKYRDIGGGRTEVS